MLMLLLFCLAFPEQGAPYPSMSLTGESLQRKLDIYTHTHTHTCTHIIKNSWENNCNCGSFDSFHLVFWWSSGAERRRREGMREREAWKRRKGKRGRSERDGEVSKRERIEAALSWADRKRMVDAAAICRCSCHCCCIINGNKVLRSAVSQMLTAPTRGDTRRRSSRRGILLPARSCPKVEATKLAPINQCSETKCTLCCLPAAVPPHHTTFFSTLSVSLRQHLAVILSSRSGRDSRLNYNKIFKLRLVSFL